METTTPMYLGVDVGGTKMLALVVTEGGEVRGRFKQATVDDGATLTAQIGAVIDGALQAVKLSIGDVKAIGLAVPGVVDSQSGRFAMAPNLKIDDPELAARVRERYGVPVAIGNDVNLGTLAEAWLGAGQGANTIVGVFVGTGIGGGVVIDGRIRTGPEDLAGEIGHLVLSVDGPECGCGNRGCWEALASRTALEREIRRALDAGRESSIAEAAKGERIRSGALAAALAAGDEVVTEAVRQVGHYLGQGLLTIRHLLDPDLVILGGGVIEACGDFLMPLLEAELHADRLKGSRDALRLVRSQLGDDAVALGAVALVRSEAGGQEVYSRAPERQDKPGKAKPAPEYPDIQGVEFGAVTVDEEELDYDLYIRANGKVRRRDKKPIRKRHGTSHVLDAEELEEVCKGSPEVVIIGQGFNGMVRLSDDAREYLGSLGVKWQALPTPDAVAAYQAASGRKALFLHVTC